MPELPEVETMVRGLRPVLEGMRLRSVVVHDPFLLQDGSAEEFERRGRGAKVESVVRRGKWVVITLAERRGLIVIQPRMTGGFRLEPPARGDHVRLMFHVKHSGRTISFCDIRRLGKIAWYAGPDEAEAAFRKSHGPDALQITRDDLTARLARTNRGIKPTLLDQKVVAGIGNIYADEVLHRARIHPERPASSLSRQEVARIHEAIGTVLALAIEAEGSSFDAGYMTPGGARGGYLSLHATAHRRRGEPCRACNTAIVKARIAGLLGRPTYFCPTCQPSRRPRGRSGRRSGDRVS